jgi:hypothetical protein
LETFLAISNQNNNATVIYRWNGVQFITNTTLATSGAVASAGFTINSTTYLAIAESGINNDAESGIYRWTGSAFTLHQRIVTNGAADVKYMTINGLHFLVYANFQNPSLGTNVPSKVYQWRGNAFGEISTILTTGALDLLPFSIGTDSFLFVVNSVSSNGGTTANSVLYKLSFQI